jgi:putative Mn2+ efflux pump MntP
MFGLSDAFAPLAGLSVGRSLAEVIGRWTEYPGPLVISGYGLYMVFLARHPSKGGQVLDDTGWIEVGQRHREILAGQI